MIAAAMYQHLTDTDYIVRLAARAAMILMVAFILRVARRPRVTRTREW